MKLYFKCKWKVVILSALTLFTLSPILAPIFRYLNFDYLADLLYNFYQFFCHERPWRSYHLFDYQLAVCSRDIGMYAGMTISAWFVYLKKFPRMTDKLTFGLFAICLLPMAFDGGSQLLAEIFTNDIIPFYESVNFVRSFTGILAGVGLGLALMSNIFDMQDKAYGGRTTLVMFVKKFGLLTFFATILIVSLNIISFSTSVKYKPSNLLVDIEQRFPGTNYEITTNCGHCGEEYVRKFIKEPLDLYCFRFEVSDNFHDRANWDKFGYDNCKK